MDKTVNILICKGKLAAGINAGMRHQVMLDGNPLGMPKREPFYGSARHLLGLGYDPTWTLEASWWDKPEVVAMSMPLGEAAKWTIKERAHGGLKRELWQPWPGQK